VLSHDHPPSFEPTLKKAKFVGRTNLGVLRDKSLLNDKNNSLDGRSSD
jgi:hypothetical protein